MATRLVILLALVTLGLPGVASAQTVRDKVDARKHIDGFRSNDKAKVGSSLKALLAMGSRAVPSLVRAMASGNKRVASFCAGTIERMDPKIAIPALVGLLGDSNEQRRSNAVGALQRIGQPAAAALEAAAKTTNPRQRQAAVFLLEKMGKTPPPATGGTKPGRTKPPKPTGGGKAPPPKAGRPKAPRRIAPRPREEPPLVRIRGETSKLVDARKALTKGLLAELERRAEEGNTAAARAVLWGVWAQCKRERHVAKNRLGQRRDRLRDAVREVEGVYQRARDACFGSSPVFSLDDGAVDLESQVAAAKVALSNGDLNSAGAVLVHVGTLRKQGLAIPAPLGKEISALHATYTKENQKRAEAFQKHGNALMTCVPIRDRKSLDQRFSELYELQGRLDNLGGMVSNVLETAHTARQMYLDLTQDVASAKKALDTLAAVAPDPEWVDRGFASMIKKNKKQRTAFAAFTENARAAVYGERLLAAWGLPARIGQVYLRCVDGYIQTAETLYQKDKGEFAAANLEQAGVALGLARELRAPADEIAAREAAIKAAKASAGVGKLKRAQKGLTAADKTLSEAEHRGSKTLQRAVGQLASAKGWVERAKVEGVTASDLQPVEQQLAKIEARVPGVYARLATKRLESVEASLAEAKKRLTDGASAWRALSSLDDAEKNRKVAADLAPHAGRKKAALVQRAAAALGQATSLRAKVEAAQRLPADVYSGAKGDSWRSSFEELLRSQRGWDVLELSIVNFDWKDKTARYEYWSGAHTKTIETRWYKHLFTWTAIADPEDETKVQLRYLGFRLHRMTDGSYRQLKLYWVDEPVPMLRANLP